MFEVGEYVTFARELEALKAKHLPVDPDEGPVVLHRKDIVNKTGPFKVLWNDQARASWDEDLLGLIKRTSFVSIAVVIDKESHSEAKHRRITHAYHYCMLAMLQRYCGRLQRIGGRGDVTAEARGGTEDQALKQSFASLYEDGGPYLSSERTRSTLSSREIKIRRKDENIAGLQLADLLAHPLTRDVLREECGLDCEFGSDFGKRVTEAATPKYNRQYSEGRIAGYGRVMLR